VAQSKGFQSIKIPLSPRDWIYVSSLLIPFVVYSIALKLNTVLTAGSTWETLGWEQNFNKEVLWLLCMMWAEASFNVGYALLWIGLFAAVRRGPLRRIVVVFFHTITIFAGMVIACAYYYTMTTGSTLDYRAIAMWIPQFEQVKPMIIHGVPHSAWILLAAVFLYTILGPWLIVRLVSRYRKWPQEVANGRSTISLLSSIVLCFLALGFGGLSWLSPVAGPTRAWFPEYLVPSDSLTADPLVNLIRTAVQEKGLRSQELSKIAHADPETENPPTKAHLLPTDPKRRNVVVIQLESTRARSVTPYNENLQTTPFLNELAKSSLLAEQAYAVVPWSSKANVATQCGVSPQFVDPAYGLVTESGPGNIPTRCLGDLLKDRKYSTVYFTSATKNFENWPTLVSNLGYEEFYSLESMDKGGFQEVNYPGTGAGYEDNIMLKPSEKWLKKHKDELFLATYHTTTPHHAYVVPERYEEKRFTEDEQLNRYLNTLRYQDSFLQKLFRQYKELGLYENTVFVILGDHGESFGEHSLNTHGFSMYEEGLRIPMLIHDANQFQSGARVAAPVSQLDVVPTVVDLLGYEIEGGISHGSSLLEPVPEDRTLVFGCLLNKCLASLKGSQKYIYYYDDKPDELYDLSKDPLERNNSADEHEEVIEERRSELLAWRLKVDTIYKRSK
jgi:lipoteichoic acid synthase